MPVFGCNPDGKWEGEELVDRGDHVAAVGDGEGAGLRAIRNRIKLKNRWAERYSDLREDRNPLVDLLQPEPA